MLFQHHDPEPLPIVPKEDDLISTVERPLSRLERTGASHRDDSERLAEVTDFVAQGLLTEHEALLTLTGRSLAGKEVAR